MARATYDLLYVLRALHLVDVASATPMVSVVMGFITRHEELRKSKARYPST